jgi:putative membrane protein
MTASVEIPYCGPAPQPGHLAWNADPLLAAVLLICAAAYCFSIRTALLSQRRQFYFWAGWTIGALALISPLCNLGVALFSARAAQHVLLTTLAAPLLVLGSIGGMADRTALRPGAKREGLTLALSALVFAAVMWAWHLPVLYDATFNSTVVYWAMHATMLSSAVLLWSATLQRGGQRLFWSLSTILVTMLQMSLLGALITFAAKPLYVVHASTTWPWGLSPLEDQQLGGLLMWVIGGVLVMAWAVLVFAQYLLREVSPTLPLTAAFRLPSYRVKAVSVIRHS